MDQKDVTRVEPMTFGTREGESSVVGKFGSIVVLASCGNLTGRIAVKREIHLFLGFNDDVIRTLGCPSMLNSQLLKSQYLDIEVVAISSSIDETVD